MKTHRSMVLFGTILLVLLFGAAQAAAQGPAPSAAHAPGGALAALGTGFTYQGYLKDSNDRPITATCDFRFRLWDDLAAGSQVGNNSLATGISVTNGYFTANVNAGGEFGANAFTGDSRWLEVSVKCGVDTLYTALSPRQALTAAPYALGLAPGAQVVGDVNNAAAIHGENTDAVSGNGVTGRTDATDGSGVFGNAAAASGATNGVWGRSASTDGAGVRGRAAATSGETYGVFGQAVSYAGVGVYGSAPLTGTEGIATATTIYGVGVYGRSDASWGAGVFGLATDKNGYNYGVQGQTSSTGGYGVFGWATATSGATFGVAGRSDSPYGIGVNGRADHGIGVNGQADDPNGIGVTGINTANNGAAYGVYGESSSPGGIAIYGTGDTGVEGETGGWLAVYGKNTSTDVSSTHIGVAGETYGSDVANRRSVAVQGYATNPSGGIGVRGLTAGEGIAVLGEAQGSYATGIYGIAPYTGTVGIATATTGTAFGVYGLSASNSGVGVYGEATYTGGPNYGVYGKTDSVAGTAVFGEATATNGNPVGVFGKVYTDGGTGVWGMAYGTDNVDSIGVFGNTYAFDGRGVKGTVNRSDGTAVGVYGYATSPAGFAVYANGNLGHTMLDSAIVKTADHGWRQLFSVESPDVLFEDVNTAQLVTGKAIVTIDPVFAETVNLMDPYQVFLSPHGDCGLYVAETTSTSFTVRAMGGQTCSLAFDYRIVAKRLGYENVHLTTTTDPTTESQGTPQENAPAGNEQP